MLFSFNGNHIFFENQTTSLSVKASVNTFPNYKHVLPRVSGYIVSLHRGKLLSDLKLIAKGIKTRNNGTCFLFSKNSLRIYREDAGSVIPRDMGINYSGPEFKTAFNSKFIIEFLEHVDSKQIEIHFSGPDSAFEWKPDNDNSGFDYRYLIMPLNIGQDDEQSGEFKDEKLCAVCREILGGTQ